jgi:hypothetical protein
VIVKTHRVLAEQIAGKKILHLCSYGKDSVLALEWLTKFAVPSKVVSLNYKYLAPHPGDEPYLKYLKSRYPDVEFISEFNPHNITRVCLGHYQSPVEVINLYKGMEFNTFEFDKLTTEYKNKYDCDFVCYGNSRSESFRRATLFHKKGILIEDRIYPLGMFSKKQIFEMIKASGFKLHPVYKLHPGTLDQPSYFKYRASFIAKPEFEKDMLRVYPLLELDKYRFEVLFKTK